MTSDDAKGLGKAIEIYNDRGVRVRALQEEGKK